MAQEFESMLTGLAGGLTKYLDLHNANKFEEAKETRKNAAERSLADYKSQLDLSNNLALELEKHKLSKDKTINSKDIKGKVAGLEWMPDDVQIKPENLLTYIAGMNKLKNKPAGKIPVGLLDKEANLTAQTTSLKQLEDMLSALPSGLSGGAASLTGFAGRGNVGTMFTNKDTASNARAYDQFADAIAVGIYRAATGDTRLSDADAKSRAKPLIPQLLESTQVRTKKISRLKSMFKEQRKVINEAQKKAMVQSGEPLGTLEDSPYSDMSNEEILKALQEAGVTGE